MATIHLGQWLPNCLVATDPDDDPKTGSAANLREGCICRPYMVLLPVGFAVPGVLPSPRWALTPPFHPYPGILANKAWPGRFAFCGTFPEVTLAGR
jgi:hypothetical protein